MTMTNEKQCLVDESSGQDLVERLEASGQLDALFTEIDACKVELTEDGGFVVAIVKAALERGLSAELTSHLGYEKGSEDTAKYANAPEAFAITEVELVREMIAAGRERLARRIRTNDVPSPTTEEIA